MSYIAERRQEEKDRRRIEIVAAAEAMYLELGWDAVTMDGVARRARLSRALVYVYFKDRRDLHFAIALRALEALRARFEAAAGQVRTGIEKIEAIGRAYMAFAQEYPHYFDACARLETQVPHPSSILEASRPVHDIVVAALASGQRDGTIRKDIGDLVVTSRVLWGFTHGTIQIAITKAAPLAEAGISASQLIEHAVALILQMLADTRAPRPAEASLAAPLGGTSA